MAKVWTGQAILQVRDFRRLSNRHFLCFSGPVVELKPRPKRTLPERAVIIQSGDLALEGLFIKKSLEHLPTVISSPHPLFGGSMDSPYLNELAYALGRHDVASLRYNFRGVGASQGVHDHGPGEQADLQAAIQFLIETHYPEKSGPVAAAGYSFGSWISYELAKSDSRLQRLLLIAPPIHKYDFSGLVKLKIPVGILVGSKDTFCPMSELENFLQDLEANHPAWDRPQVMIVPHASHYFVRGLSEAGEGGAVFLKTGRFPEGVE